MLPTAYDLFVFCFYLGLANISLRCEKKRTITANSTRHHGNIEPVAFLLVWYKVHPDDTPHAVDVDMWIANEMEDFMSEVGHLLDLSDPDL